MENKSASLTEKQFKKETLEGLRKRKMLADLIGSTDRDLAIIENLGIMNKASDAVLESPVNGMMSDIPNADLNTLNPSRAGSLPMVRGPMYDSIIKLLIEGKK